MTTLHREDYKSIFASKTVWGLLVTVLGAFGVPVPDNFTTEVTDIINQGFVIGGSVLALFGRFKAEKNLKVL